MANFNFCPVCAKSLVWQTWFGSTHQVCPDSSCGYVVFHDPKLVSVVLVEHEGKILLGKRNIEPGKGLWTFLGGYIDRGERVEDAARREVKEETNLEVELIRLLGVYSQVDNPIVLIAYAAKVKGSLEDMRPQESETSELAFVRPSEMPELAFHFDRQILNDWLDKPL